jgi:predicted O-methyltransferase YrrM
VNLLGEIEALAPDLERIGAGPPPQPRWTQDWFPRLDAAAAYAMVRATRPRRIVEVGSGHSTRFLARAVRDGGLDTRLTAIDPAPRASLEGLAITFVPKRVQDAGLEPFAALAAGDVLFIDSSHQVKAGSDVEFLLGRVLPKLERGARVHFHDIFLPDDYPRGWEWRRYNEQPAVQSLLAAGYVQEFSSHQALKQRKLEGVLARLPLVPGALESSLWLRKL